MAGSVEWRDEGALEELIPIVYPSFATGSPVFTLRAGHRTTTHWNRLHW